MNRSHQREKRHPVTVRHLALPKARSRTAHTLSSMHKCAIGMTARLNTPQLPVCTHLAAPSMASDPNSVQNQRDQLKAWEEAISQKETELVTI
jgi:hypothetical protein